MKKSFFWFSILGLLAVLLVACSSSAEHKFHGTSLSGVIDTIDLESHTLTLNNLKSSSVTELTWDKDSKFWANDTPIEPRQLQRGDAVRIHYRNRDGQMWLQHLYLRTNRTIH